MSDAEEIGNMAVDVITAMTKKMIAEDTTKLLATNYMMFCENLMKSGFSNVQAIKIVCASLKGQGK